MKNVITSIGLMTVVLLMFQAHALNTQDAATKLGGTEYKEVLFARNATNLTDAQKEEIRSVVSNAASRGTIDHVKIMAWSDVDYPPQAINQTKGEVALTQDRLSYLQAFVKSDLKVANVEMYNMTDRPDSIDRLVSSVGTPGSATEVYDDRAQASKGVIIVFMKK